MKTLEEKKKKFETVDGIVIYILMLYLLPVPIILSNLFTMELKGEQQSWVQTILIMAFYIPLILAQNRLKITRR